jgi:hypothetical protein
MTLLEYYKEYFIKIFFLGVIRKSGIVMLLKEEDLMWYNFVFKDLVSRFFKGFGIWEIWDFFER